jgi:hypothetical protein
MNNKLAFVLFLLAFVAGFFLREMFYGISIPPGQASYVNNRDITMDDAFKNTVNVTRNETQIPQIAKIVVPRKAFRGTSFEMIVYLKPPKQLSGSYNLDIMLYSLNDETKINAGSYHLVADQEWLGDELIKVGPFMASVPGGVPLGRYNIEIGLKSSEAAKECYALLPYVNSGIDYPDGMITVTN